MQKKIEIQYEVKWEGRYSQCSFNNLATILDYFYGVPDEYPPEEDFKRALPSKMAGLFGWAPYTGYMVKSQKLKWNAHQVKDLDCTWFELKAQKNGERGYGMSFFIQLAEGELEKLEEELVMHLKKGPLILWVPYGAGGFRFTPYADWKNIRKIGDNKYQAIVPWFTHCIVLGGYTNRLFRVVDCSDLNGIFLISPEQLIINVLAMNVNPAVKKLAFLDGYAFHCCFFRK